MLVFRGNLEKFKAEMILAEFKKPNFKVKFKGKK